MIAELETLAAAACALEKGTVSAVELTKAKLAICDQAEPTLRNFITLDPKNALNMAAAADERRKIRDEVSPLTGIPVAFKDIIDVGGMRCTGHSRLYADRMARADAFTVSPAKWAVLMASWRPMSAIGLHDRVALAPQPRGPGTRSRTGGSSSGSGSAFALGDLAAPDQIPASILVSARSTVCCEAVRGLISSQGRWPCPGRWTM
jgi:aspartyl-tRNA(Asn)/glutamyl-tRNA(Gln) amidotransferase subunit A